MNKVTQEEKRKKIQKKNKKAQNEDDVTFEINDLKRFYKNSKTGIKDLPRKAKAPRKYADVD